MKMLRVVIESPYSGNVERNVAYAKRCLLDSVMRRGEAPIASHLLFTQIGLLDDNNLEHRAAGIAAGVAWIRVADLVAFYTDYGYSQGMLFAREYCLKAGIPWEERKLGVPHSD